MGEVGSEMNGASLKEYKGSRQSPLCGGAESGTVVVSGPDLARVVAVRRKVVELAGG
jgi:hypothetical protein